MKRNLDFNEISDGKRYKRNDLAKISCNGCAGCSKCCQFTDDTIHLDPYDIYCLSLATGMDFNNMMTSNLISLTVTDGVITPYLTKKSNGSCVFLSDEGRCKIHESRPGFCRLFPLGRIYNEDGTFDYFIQIHECPYPSKSKIKIDKWLGIGNLSEYEKYITSYHNLIGQIKEAGVSGNDELLKKLNMDLLNKFFIPPYEPGFYPDYYNRIK